MKKLNILLVAFLISGGLFAQTNWKIDKYHSKIRFAVSHMAVSETEGDFKEFAGTVSSKSDDFNGAEVEFTAQVSSINTENEQRDGHLKSDDFFNAEKYPEIKFKGKIVKEGKNYKLKGDFTMRDVTKSVTFDLVYNGTIDTGKGIKAGFKVNGKVNRQDYGLKFNAKLGTGDLVVGDDVEFTCKIELDKA